MQKDHIEMLKQTSFLAILSLTLLGCDVAPVSDDPVDICNNYTCYPKQQTSYLEKRQLQHELRYAKAREQHQRNLLQQENEAHRLALQAEQELLRQQHQAQLQELRLEHQRQIAALQQEKRKKQEEIIAAHNAKKDLETAKKVGDLKSDLHNELLSKVKRID